MRSEIKAVAFSLGLFFGLWSVPSHSATCVDSLEEKVGAIGKIISCLKELNAENNELQKKIVNLQKLIEIRGNDVIFVGRMTNPTTQFKIPAKTNVTVLVFSSIAQADGGRTDTINLIVSSTKNSANSILGSSSRDVIKGGASGHYWGYSTLLPIVVEISNQNDVDEIFQAKLSGSFSSGTDHVILVTRK